MAFTINPCAVCGNNIDLLENWCKLTGRSVSPINAIYFHRKCLLESAGEKFVPTLTPNTWLPFDDQIARVTWDQLMLNDIEPFDESKDKK